MYDYPNELKTYLEKRLAKNRRSVQLVTGGDHYMMKILQAGWIIEFYRGRCDELERCISGMEDVIEGKDGEIANLNDTIEREG